MFDSLGGKTEAFLSIVKGTSKNSFLLRTATISSGGVVRPKKPPRHSFDYACGDFDLPPKPEKISHVLVTKAIFRGPLNARRSIH